MRLAITKRKTPITLEAYDWLCAFSSFSYCHEKRCFREIAKTLTIIVSVLGLWEKKNSFIYYFLFFIPCSTNSVKQEFFDNKLFSCFGKFFFFLTSESSILHRSQTSCFLAIICTTYSKYKVFGCCIHRPSACRGTSLEFSRHCCRTCHPPLLSFFDHYFYYYYITVFAHTLRGFSSLCAKYLSWSVRGSVYMVKYKYTYYSTFLSILGYSREWNFAADFDCKNR